MPLFGSPNVDAMKAKRDVKGLFRPMTTDQSDLGKQASAALVEIGASVVNPMLDLAQKAKDESKARGAVIGVFQAMGSPAVEPLLAPLRSTNYQRRLVAVHALGTMNDAPAGAPILDVLKDSASGNWMARFRRMARDYERLAETLAGLHFVAFAMPMAHRFVTLMVQSA
jgi:HEAT repeat protein